MGEIRVKVKLMNLNDETRFRHGELKKEDIRIYEADAMVDTGAVRSVIPVHVLQQLGVGTRGTRVAEYADRAMKMLHKAVKAGYSNAAQMAKDKDLDSLRGRADFKKLLADLEKKSPP